MIHTYQDGKVIIKTIVVSIFVLILISYSIFQANKILTGPTITISVPRDATIHGKGVWLIEGKTKNIAFISINDQQIYVDEQGVFKERLALYKGYNIIKLYGKDKFGKSLTRLVEVTYQP